MIFIKAFAQKIKEKNQNAITSLKYRLTNRAQSELANSKSITDLKNAYLNQELAPEFRNSSKNQHLNSPKVRVNPAKSEHKFKGSLNLQKLRNSSSNARDTPAQELKMKKEKLMLQLKEIDLQMKSKHQDQCLQRLKRNRTEAQIDRESYERAAKLVEKMNRQRKEMAEKKVKETLLLKQTVQESLQKFKELQELKKEENLKKKIEIEKRIQDRKLKAVERNKLNKMSDQIIKEIYSYKVSLPQIYLKKYETPYLNKQEVHEVLLTNLDEDDKKGYRYNRESRVSSFLENVHQQELEKRKISQQKRQYQKRIREKHLQFGNKVRLHQKLRLDRQKSQNKIERKLLKRQQFPSRFDKDESQIETLSYLQPIQ